MPAQRNDFSGKTAGGYNGGFLAEFLFNPVYHAVDAGRIAIERAALHTFNRILADQGAWADQG